LFPLDYDKREQFFPFDLNAVPAVPGVPARKQHSPRDHHFFRDPHTVVFADSTRSEKMRVSGVAAVFEREQREQREQAEIRVYYQCVILFPPPKADIFRAGTAGTKYNHGFTRDRDHQS
jgi:hypothetical protein